MEDQEINLEGLLNQLYSDEARFAFIWTSRKLETSGIERPQHRYDQLDGDLAESYEEYEAKRWTYTARIAERVGLKEIAIRFYEKAGDYVYEDTRGYTAYPQYPWQYLNAARIAQEMGMTKKAHQLYTMSIEYCEEKGYYRDAAKIAQEAGMRKRANKLYIRVIKRILAHVYENKKAIINDAAVVALEAGMTKRAIKFYEKAGMYDGAAKVALEAGMTKRAIKFYEKAGMYDGAAKVALEAGMTKKAHQICKEKRRCVDATNMMEIKDCEKKGDYENAAKIAQEAGMTDRVNLYRHIEELLK